MQDKNAFSTVLMSDEALIGSVMKFCERQDSKGVFNLSNQFCNFAEKWGMQHGNPKFWEFNRLKFLTFFAVYNGKK